MSCVSLRSALAASSAAIVLASCSPDTMQPPAEGVPAAALAPGWHRLDVSVVDPAGNPAANVVVTVTNVGTGDFLVELTGPKGRADFDLPAGSYLIHARNLSDPGPVLNPFPVPLVIAPLPEGSGLISTGPTQGLNRLGVLYDPNAPNTSAPLDPDNYSRLTASPPLVLSGPSSHNFVSLKFQTGSPLTCTFLDDTGTPINLPTTENVFVILPHGSGPLPPLPSYVAGQNLPRGILLGVTTAPAGASSCALAGLGGTTAVIETNAVPSGPDEKVFVGQANGTGQVRLIEEPRRSQIGYLLDRFGDATGTEDLGLTTFGWTLGNSGPTDDFVVTTRFQGAGDYLVGIDWTSPTPTHIDAVIRCTDNGCTVTGVEPASQARNVRIKSVILLNGDKVSGNFEVTFTIPGVNNLNLRVRGGRPPRSDFAPDSGSQPAEKAGTGNTWLIPGD